MITTTRGTTEFNKLRGCSCQCQAAAAAREVLGREFKLLLSRRPSKRILVLESLMTEDELAGPWDYIFSAGLFASLPDREAKDLLRRAAHSLAPGGVLMIANVKPKTNAGTCTGCTGQSPFAREEHELAALTCGIPDSVLVGQLVFGDESAVNAYLELSAAPAGTYTELIGVVRTAVQ